MIKLEYVRADGEIASTHYTTRNEKTEFKFPGDKDWRKTSPETLQEDVLQATKENYATILSCWTGHQVDTEATLRMWVS